MYPYKFMIKVRAENYKVDKIGALVKRLKESL